jgi:hypothetical protein
MVSYTFASVQKYPQNKRMLACSPSRVFADVRLGWRLVDVID